MAGKAPAVMASTRSPDFVARHAPSEEAAIHEGDHMESPPGRQPDKKEEIDDHHRIGAFPVSRDQSVSVLNRITRLISRWAMLKSIKPRIRIEPAANTLSAYGFATSSIAGPKVQATASL